MATGKITGIMHWDAREAGPGTVDSPENTCYLRIPMTVRWPTTAIDAVALSKIIEPVLMARNDPNALDAWWRRTWR